MNRTLAAAAIVAACLTACEPPAATARPPPDTPAERPKVETPAAWRGDWCVCAYSCAVEVLTRLLATAYLTEAIGTT